MASEDQRDALVEQAVGDDFLAPHSYIVISRSFEDEQGMAGTQAELTAVGHAVQVIDLRTR